jgi:hypothetical protein
MQYGYDIKMNTKTDQASAGTKKDQQWTKMGKNRNMYHGTPSKDSSQGDMWQLSG